MNCAVTSRDGHMACPIALFSHKVESLSTQTMVPTVALIITSTLV